MFEMSPSPDVVQVANSDAFGVGVLVGILAGLGAQILWQIGVAIRSHRRRPRLTPLYHWRESGDLAFTVKNGGKEIARGGVCLVYAPKVLAPKALRGGQDVGEEERAAISYTGFQASTMLPVIPGPSYHLATLGFGALLTKEWTFHVEIWFENCTPVIQSLVVQPPTGRG